MYDPKGRARHRQPLVPDSDRAAMAEVLSRLTEERSAEHELEDQEEDEV